MSVFGVTLSALERASVSKSALYAAESCLSSGKYIWAETGCHLQRKPMGRFACPFGPETPGSEIWGDGNF